MMTPNNFHFIFEFVQSIPLLNREILISENAVIHQPQKSEIPGIQEKPFRHFGVWTLDSGVFGLFGAVFSRLQKQSSLGRSQVMTRPAGTVMTLRGR
jgi:hypothetical protein